MAERKRKRLEDAESVELDMTPMIDIVFQMILFFVIITDFTQKDIALLELPWSVAGEDDEGDDDSRIIINITAPVPSNPDPKKWTKDRMSEANRILIRGKAMSFRNLYEYLAQNGRKNLKYQDPKNKKLSNRSVLIRCDGMQAFDYVKIVLQICANPDIAIYKIEIATSEQASKQG